MNKILILLIITTNLFYLILGTPLTFTDVTYDKSKNHKYCGYDGTCTIETFATLKDPQNTDLSKFQVYPQETEASFFYANKRNISPLGGNAYFQLLFVNVNAGFGPFTVIGTNGFENVTLYLDISCIQPLKSEIQIIDQTELHTSVFGFSSARFKVGGLQYPFVTATLSGTNTYQMILGNSYISCYIIRSSTLVEPTVGVNLKLSAIEGSIDIFFNNDYKSDNVEFITDFKLYPDNQQDIELMGNLYAPVFTWKSNSTYYSPSFRLLVNNNPALSNGFDFRIISTEGLITTYIGFINYNGIRNVLLNYSLVAQDKNLNTIRESFLLNIKAAPFGLSQLVGSITQSDVLININFQSTDEYYYSPVYFGYYVDTISNFPFGYKSGSNKIGYTYSATQLMVSYDISSISKQFYVYKNYEDKANSGFKKSLDSPLPIPNLFLYEIGQHSLTHLYDNIFLLRIEITNPFPLYKFKIGNTIFNFSTLGTGNYYGGIFEFILDSISEWAGLQINDLMNFAVPINNGQIYSFNYPPIVNTFLFQTGFDFLDIKNVSILYKTMNATNQEAGNILYFNYTNIDINTPISFIVNGPTTYNGDTYPKITQDYYDRMYHAQWNSTIKMFQVEFWLPKNSQPGVVPFALIFTFDRWVLSGDMGENAQFTVISNNADLQGPIFTRVEKFPSDSVTMSSTTLSIPFGWILTIEDASGFRDGTVKVRGVDDGSVYNIKLTADSNLNSAKYTIKLNGVVDFQNGGCFSQDYIISDVILYDIENNNSTFSITYEVASLSRSLYNPFINYLNDTNINRISITCETNIVDSTPPEIMSLQPSHQTINVGAINRTVFFSLKAVDPESGLKLDHFPTIYLTTENMETISCISKGYLKITTTSNIYEYQVDLPLGFGYPNGILISVYGLVNGGGYYGGYSTSDLLANSFQYKIDTAYTNDQPIIIGSSRISTNGGQLWVHGRGFKNVQSISLNDVIVLTINKTLGNVAILIQDVPAMDIPFSITIHTDLYASNSYFITPYKRPVPTVSEIIDSSSSSDSTSSTPIPTLTPTPSETPSITPIPTNKPQRCLGNPECGGPNQGYCNTKTGCICLSPWIGVDCSSKVIIVPQPIINSTGPSIEIIISPIGSSNSNPIDEILYKSFISLVSIRELSFNDEVIFTKTFDKWIYTKINDLKFKYDCNISKTISSDGSTVIDTPISVSLEWFNQQTNITFADQLLTMNPSTLKYTIDIGKYKFSNQLNRLELVMSATFGSSQTNSNDICSSSEFGDTSSNDNSNYLKLSIEDHSMYARFLKRGIVDGNVVSINNRLLDSSLKQHPDTEYSTSSFIGIAIPKFDQFVSIDPDFSVLLNHDSASDNDDSICSLNKSSLSNGAIAGIVVGGVAFVSVIIITSIYFIYNSKKNAKFLKSMNNKLGNIN